MKAATILAVALSGVALAVPERKVPQGTDASKPFKDLTNLKYSDELPVADASAPIERRSGAPVPVKDNRNLHYNAKNKFPIAIAVPETDEASVERRGVPVEAREAPKPTKDNRNLHYNANSRMPLAVSE